MKRRLIKKLIVLHNLQIVLHEIFQEENWEYCCYKEEVQDASPIKYIDEILLIGRSQLKTSKQIKAVRRYYHCDVDTAILLHKLTDAYVLIYCPLKYIKMPG